MTGYSDQTQPDKSELSASQQEMLDLLEQRELLDAFNQVLIDRGIPLEVTRVDFRDLPRVSAEDAGIGPDPSAGPDVPPGTHNYMCTNPGGVWVCMSNPGTTVSTPPVSVEAPPGSNCT
jgi:hypothetical protein